MPAAVEDDVLPDFIAKRIGAEAAAESGQEREILVREDRCGRVERIVEQDDLGLRREGLRKRRLGEPEARGREGDEARHAPCPTHERQVGVVHRLEQHDLVAGLDQRHQGSGESLGCTGRHHDFRFRIEVEALPMPVMGGNGGAKLREPHHRRILVPAVDDRIGGLAADVLGPRIVREALAEIDRAGFPGKAGHDLENGGRQIGEYRVHASSHRVRAAS